MTYEGVGATKKWERIESYGLKFVENIVQAISRDLLCYSMRKLKEYEICAHVHDEIIVECGMDESLETVCKLMGEWSLGRMGMKLCFIKKIDAIGTVV